MFQVDERVAPDGDPDRNLTHLRESLGAAPAEVAAMPVNDTDLDAAAAAYGRSLPGVSTSFTWASARTGTPPRWCHGTRCSKSRTGWWP